MVKRLNREVYDFTLEETVTVEFLIGTGNELKKVANSILRHQKSTDIFYPYSDKPKFKSYKMYGLAFTPIGRSLKMEVWDSDSLVSLLLEI